MLNLIPPKPRDTIHNNPRQATSKIHSLVHDEAHDARREDVVLHVDVPREPEALKVVERHIVLGHFFELAPVRVLRVAEGVGARGGVGISARTRMC